MIDHIAIAVNSELESDKFFIQLLDLKKLRQKVVPIVLIEKFFGVRKEQRLLVYGNDRISFEVFITDDNSKAKDIFTHSCLLIENRDELVKKAISLGFKVIQVPRDDGNGYYLFIKDSFQNLYEIKEL